MGLFQKQIQRTRLVSPQEQMKERIQIQIQNLKEQREKDKKAIAVLESRLKVM